MSLPAGTSVQGGATGGTSGNNDVRAATGNRNYNIGGNPNVSQALQSPIFLIGAAVVLVVWFRFRK